MMNERIRELADSAAKYSAVMAMKSDESANELFVEHLVRSVVRECAMEAIDEVAFQGGSVAIEAGIRQRLYTHFGVEE